MTATIVEALQEVAEAPEFVTIAYNGGSHPGQPRKFVARNVKRDGFFASDAPLGFPKAYEIANDGSEAR